MPGTQEIKVTIDRDQLQQQLNELIGTRVLVEAATVGRLIARHGCPNAQAAMESMSPAGLAKPDQPRPCPTCDLARELFAGWTPPTVIGDPS